MMEKLKTLFLQLQDCHDKKDWDGVIRCSSQIIDFPEDQISEEDRAIALNYRGDAFVNKNEFDRAFRDFDQAITLKPDFVEALNNRGHAFAKTGKNDSAIRDFDNALKLNPDDAVVLNNRGAALVKKGEFDLAIRDFDQAIKFKPDDADALYNRGNAFAKKGELNLAISDFNNALKLKPNYTEALNNRGIAFANKGKLDSAIRDFDNVLKLNSDDVQALNNRGNAFMGKGELGRAISDFEQALMIKPDYPEALNNRGVAYEKKGKFEHAIRDYDQAIKLKPDYVEAFQNRALALAQIHARETEQKYQKEHEEQLRQIKESHDRALRQVTDPVDIIKSYQDRGDKYVKQINSINWGSRFFIFLLSVILIGGFLAITFVVFYAWGYLAFGSSDCDIPNCSAPGVVISTDRGKVSFAGLLAIAPIMLALFTACFPFIAQLFNLWKEKRRLQVCVEDYFRKQTLVRYTLLAKDEHKQRLIAITHAHFATRSAAEFLAGWKQESEENSHPLTDAIDKAIRDAKDAVSRKPTEKSLS